MTLENNLHTHNPKHRFGSLTYAPMIRRHDYRHLIILVGIQSYFDAISVPLGIWLPISVCNKGEKQYVYTSGGGDTTSIKLLLSMDIHQAP
jgi:hypothetical protein